MSAPFNAIYAQTFVAFSSLESECHADAFPLYTFSALLFKVVSVIFLQTAVSKIRGFQKCLSMAPLIPVTDDDLAISSTSDSFPRISEPSVELKILKSVDVEPRLLSRTKPASSESTDVIQSRAVFVNLNVISYSDCDPLIQSRSTRSPRQHSSYITILSKAGRPNCRTT
jgi:hypothetical protein